MTMLPLPKILTCLLLIMQASSLAALTVESNAIPNRALYGIVFPGESRAYYGKESSLLSVSIQAYNTATFNVVEINLATDGNALLRIYHSRPARPEDLLEPASNAAGAAGFQPSIIQRPLPPGVQTMSDRAAAVSEAFTDSTVIKEYPFATHAQTIEFRMRDRRELYDLFNELKKHWLKEPAYFQDGQIADQTEATSDEMRPRSLGGTIFRVER